MSKRILDLEAQVANAEAEFRHLRAIESSGWRVLRDHKGSSEAGPLPWRASVKARIIVDIFGWTSTTMEILRVLFRRRVEGWEKSGLPFSPEEIAKHIMTPTVGAMADDWRDAGDENNHVFRIARLVAEVRVCRKIQNMTTKACSVTSTQIVEWLREKWPPELRGDKFRSYFRALLFSPKKCKNLRRRFIRFWGVRYCKLDITDHVDPALLQDRVNSFLFSMFLKSTRAKRWTRLGPTGETIFGLKNGSTLVQFLYKAFISPGNRWGPK